MQNFCGRGKLPGAALAPACRDALGGFPVPEGESSYQLFSFATPSLTMGTRLPALLRMKSVSLPL